MAYMIKTTTGLGIERTIANSSRVRVTGLDIYIYIEIHTVVLSRDSDTLCRHCQGPYILDMLSKLRQRTELEGTDGTRKTC